MHYQKLFINYIIRSACGLWWIIQQANINDSNRLVDENSREFSVQPAGVLIKMHHSLGIMAY